MKKTFLTLFGILIMSFCSAQRILISVSEQDAQIIADGKKMGGGPLEINVLRKGCVNVRVQKVGFLTREQNFCWDNYPPKKYFFEMQKDDAFEASDKTDNANIDFSVTVNSKIPEAELWKLVTQIVTDYFDAIEVSDKETYYLRTAWNVQTFQQNTIRTRLIVKLGKSSPLTFKIKLVSESSGTSGTSVKADEQFREWDRVLRKYGDFITIFQSRVGNN